MPLVACQYALKAVHRFYVTPSQRPTLWTVKNINKKKIIKSLNLIGFWILMYQWIEKGIIHNWISHCLGFTGIFMYKFKKHFHKVFFEFIHEYTCEPQTMWYSCINSKNILWKCENGNEELKNLEKIFWNKLAQSLFQPSI